MQRLWFHMQEMFRSASLLVKVKSCELCKRYRRLYAQWLLPKQSTTLKADATGTLLQQTQPK